MIALLGSALTASDAALTWHFMLESLDQNQVSEPEPVTISLESQFDFLLYVLSVVQSI